VRHAGDVIALMTARHRACLKASRPRSTRTDGEIELVRDSAAKAVAIPRQRRSLASFDPDKGHLHDEAVAVNERLSFYPSSTVNSTRGASGTLTFGMNQRGTGDCAKACQRELRAKAALTTHRPPRPAGRHIGYTQRRDPRTRRGRASSLPLPSGHYICRKAVRQAVVAI
jgi:hypothetical protein